MIQLIDSHIHFWEPTQLTYAWLNDVPAINHAYLPSDLPTQGDGWRMDKLVFVQADCLPAQGLQEAKWVTQLAQDDARIQGIVAVAPLEQTDYAQHLEQLQALPLVKGVRRLIQSEGAGFCTQPAFVRAVQALPRYGYSFDICVVHHQLGDVLELVAQCPQVAFVLDHLGKPPIREGEIERWKGDINLLARFENVACKFSGMVTEADWEGWNMAHLQPFVDVMLDAFGPERILFGGDFPLHELAFLNYHGWVNTALTLLEGLSEHELHAIFYANAQQFYRLNA